MLLLGRECAGEGAGEDVGKMIEGSTAFLSARHIMKMRRRQMISEALGGGEKRNVSSF